MDSLTALRWQAIKAIRVFLADPSVQSQKDLNAVRRRWEADVEALGMDGYEGWHACYDTVEYEAWEMRRSKTMPRPYLRARAVGPWHIATDQTTWRTLCGLDQPDAGWQDTTDRAEAPHVCASCQGAHRRLHGMSLPR